jgi:hypothetical protein
MEIELGILEAVNESQEVRRMYHAKIQWNDQRVLGRFGKPNGIDLGNLTLQKISALASIVGGDGGIAR